MNPNSVRKSYHLTSAGLKSLRTSVERVRPWDRSTGLRTAEGKAWSRLNAYEHGARSAEFIALNRHAAQALRLLKKASLGPNS